MDPIQFPESFSEFSVEQLTELRANAFTQLSAMFAIEAPTAEQAAEAERLANGIRSVDAEVTARNERAAQLAAMRQEFSAPAEQPAEEAPAEEVEEQPAEETPAEETPAEEPAAQPAEQQPAGDQSATGDQTQTPPAQEAAVTQPAPELNSAAVAGQRPATPATPQRSRIRAVPDVPGVATSAELDSLQLAETYIDRFISFPAPAGHSEEFGSDPNQLRTFGHATLAKPIPDDLRINPQMGPAEIEAVFDRAIDQSRLPGGSLVAAGGWCAPSELSYSLSDDGATNEGILTLPEVGMPRGGIRHTLGPDWADIYAKTNFFKNTEAQVVAGTATKPCFTVDCPTFTDHRLDAYGYCFQIPFLTEAAYPEVIRRYLQGSLLAYQHKMNADKIQRLIALLPAAETVPAFGSLATTLFGRIQLILDRERTKRRWGMNQAVQVDLPMWVKGAIKTDISLRTGTNLQAVTDQQVNALFAAVNAVPTWLYDWAGQDLDQAALDYPDTFDMLVYKAGTFVVGTTDVVNLSSVYDAASLAQNVYTGAFFEEGMTMVRMGYGGVRLTVPTCVAGLTGEASVVCPA